MVVDRDGGSGEKCGDFGEELLDEREGFRFGCEEVGGVGPVGSHGGFFAPEVAISQFRVGGEGGGDVGGKRDDGDDFDVAGFRVGHDLADEFLSIVAAVFFVIRAEAIAVGRSRGADGSDGGELGVFF